MAEDVGAEGVMLILASGGAADNVSGQYFGNLCLNKMAMDKYFNVIFSPSVSFISLIQYLCSFESRAQGEMDLEVVLRICTLSCTVKTFYFYSTTSEQSVVLFQMRVVLSFINQVIN